MSVKGGDCRGTRFFIEIHTCLLPVSHHRICFPFAIYDYLVFRCFFTPYGPEHENSPLPGKSYEAIPSCLTRKYD